MVLRRVLRGSFRIGLRGVMLIPLLALLPAALLDLGPEGNARVTVFPLALALLDPFVWHCVGNSLAVAGVVAVGSLGIGVILGHILSRWRFWGRWPLAILAWSPLAVPSLYLAVGVRRVLDGGTLARLSTLLDTNLGFERAGDWLGLVWLGLAGGVPLVSLVSVRALGRVQSAWEEAGRAAGASRRRIWWTLVWPLVRPDILRAAALVFTLSWIEPGGPLLLGLRRTLAFQLVEAASGAADPTRAASLSLMAMAIAGAVRLLVLGWAGRTQLPQVSCLYQVPKRAGWLRAAGYVTVLGLWLSLTWWPCLGLVELAASATGGGSGQPGSLSALAFVRGLEHPDVAGLAVRSIVLGLLVGGIALVFGWILSADEARPGSREAHQTSWFPFVVPPLALGIGVALVPRLLRLTAAVLGARGGLGFVADSLAVLLDPYATPEFALIWALSLIRAPILVAVCREVRRRARPDWVEIAWTLGASRRRAWWTIALPTWMGRLGGFLLLSITLTATDATAALVLTPVSSSWTFGPGVLHLAETPGALPTAAALSLIAVLGNAFAFALALRGTGLGRGPRDTTPVGIG